MVMNRRYTVVYLGSNGGGFGCGGLWWVVVAMTTDGMIGFGDITQ